MDIRELKQRLTIIEVAACLDIKMNRHGKAICPFHDDKNPSLQFSKEKNICTCFSSRCNAGTMDIIELTKRKLKLTTHEAINYLKAMAGTSNTIKKETRKPVATAQGRIATLTKIYSYFRKAIYNSQQAKAYTEKRRSLDIDKIEIGYNSGQFHHRENKYLIKSCVEAGLLKENPSGGYYVWGKYCIIFPLKNKNNQIVSLYGRSIQNDKEQRHFYLKDREGLYPHYPKKETQTLILTESIIDAATLIQAIGNRQERVEILALYGVNGLTDEHTEAIKELKELEEIIFFLNGDEAGREAVIKYSELLRELKPEVIITNVAPPEKEDINSLVCSHDGDVLKHLIDKRTFIFSTEKEADSMKLTADNKKAEEENNADTLTQEHLNTLNTNNPYKLYYTTDLATYYIMGGIKKDLDSLRVTLVIEHPVTKNKSRNKLDLYEDKQIEKAAREAGEKLQLRSDLIETDLTILTDLLEKHREEQMKGKEEEKKEVVISQDATKQCIDFLSKPRLVKRLNDLIGKAGVVGEEINRIFLLGIVASYKTSTPLHALLQGSSGSGKTHLLIKISELMPPEDVITLTRVTESSFYNYGEYELKNKLLCMEDLDGLKEEALLAFRELQSRGMLSSSTSGKDEQGNIRSFVRTVRGPIASISATTKGEIYEDNMSRSFLVVVDESKEQTRRIIEYQNNRAAGMIDTEREKQVSGFIRNCMRLIKPYEVINPYANKVNLPEEAHKIRRLNELYQSYVKQITLLNQYRRKQDSKGRLISEREDLEIAGEIMFDSIILKIDELDGMLRLFYEKLKEYIKTKGGSTYRNYSFGRKEVRDTLRISKTQQHRFFEDLIRLEYIHQVGGGRYQGHKYKILEWDDIRALRRRIKQYLKGQLDQLEMFQSVPENPEHQNKR